jgi:hypothetical protein
MGEDVGETDGVGDGEGDGFALPPLPVEQPDKIQVDNINREKIKNTNNRLTNSDLKRISPLTYLFLCFCVIILCGFIFAQLFMNFANCE